MRDEYIKFKNILNIEEISGDINFWLVRTKKGIFYDEYSENNFIALGWNYIDSKNINEENIDNIENLKNNIKEIYKTKQGTAIFNKCDKFINEMMPGDIVMIPSAHNEKIMFAIVGDYFEKNLDYKKELEVISRIDSGEDYGIDIECPYKKRRTIKKLKTISGDRLNPNLYKVLASYHGLSKINKYSDFILRSIYTLYTHENKLNLVIPIETTKNIDTTTLAEFILGITKVVKSEDENIKVTGKVDLNSPGDFQFIINDAINFLSSNHNLGALLSIVGTICTGKYGPDIFKSFLNFIIEWRKTSSQIKNEEVDRQLKQIQIQKELMDLAENSRRLEVNEDNVSNVINLAEIIHGNENN
ncbi:hypothetical protein G8S49_11400 [Clostridium botulinum C]|uniref:Uncharacterized protein n=2 Tax=Clostridium botulinum TaxID=1491 RepID=A0A9Q4TJE4_CLOBO|nr:hypothetical protein [Clostridium botulinum]EGO86285.1 hypothetical protein CBCST_22850 [Clostridium botulinum C str. Stockholm]MCD3195759.1 hypothetical protein [Clostridium botulinum C]MCD3201175.1 hypothetical protein [Clostridium botulinum C]MCD3206655.1 hypothetical protein [Clostridium botulinum C]MCD3209346.1 hypothetical protein [Clostridium botulinum C]